jgi:hypothetical protein
VADEGAARARQTGLSALAVVACGASPEKITMIGGDVLRGITRESRTRVWFEFDY